MTCPKCQDTGWFKYDHNHMQVCDHCCKHDKGRWQLIDYYGSDNGKWCCKAGCGKIWDEAAGKVSKITMI